MTKTLQLNPLAKILLLKHRMTRQDVEIDEFGGVFQYEDSRTQLFKFLAVSKSFLYLSRRKNIYDFNILNHSDEDNEFILAFECGFKRNEHVSFHLPFEETQKLIQFLRPQKVDISFDCIRKFGVLRQAKELLNLTDGKIKIHIILRDGIVASAIQVLLKHHDRISELSCFADILSETELIPRLKLDSCFLTDLQSYDQLNAVLQNHDIKELRLCSNSEDGEDPFKFEDLDNFMAAPSVNSLEINYSNDAQIEIFLEKTARLIGFFPNLRSFNFELYSQESDVLFGNSTVYNAIINVYNGCRQIEKSGNSKTTLNFYLDKHFELDNVSDYSNDWHIWLKKHPDFAHIKYVETRVCPRRTFFEVRHRIEDGHFNFCINISIATRFIGAVNDDVDEEDEE